MQILKTRGNFFVEKTITILFSLILILASNQKIEASCGLEFCPVRYPQGHQGETSSHYGLQLPVSYRFVEFDIGGRGTYHATFIQPQYSQENFSLSALLPIVALQSNKGNTVGLANPILMGEYLFLDGKHKISGGSQLEIPMPDNHDGIAESHFMPIPYVTFISIFDHLYTSAQLGFLFTVGGHSHGPVQIRYFNPHSNQEFLYRSTLGYHFGRISSEVYLNGRQVTDHNATGDKSFLGTGTNQRIKITDRSELNLNLEIPVLSKNRELLRAGAGIFLKF